MAKKSLNAQLKDLRADLHYFQDQHRTELRWVRQSAAKCKEIGERMRKLQKEIADAKKARKNK